MLHLVSWTAVAPVLRSLAPAPRTPTLVTARHRVPLPRLSAGRPALTGTTRCYARPVAIGANTFGKPALPGCPSILISGLVVGHKQHLQLGERRRHANFDRGQAVFRRACRVPQRIRRAIDEPQGAPDGDDVFDSILQLSRRAHRMYFVDCRVAAVAAVRAFFEERDGCSSVRLCVASDVNGVDTCAALSGDVAGLRRRGGP